MANRQIYQVDLLYVGPTGVNPATGRHFSAAGAGAALNTSAAYSGSNLVAELYRVQRADYNFQQSLQDVNQFGELAAIDRISVDQPVVNMTFNYLLSNLINEELIGLTVAKAGSASEVSCVSGILNGTTDNKNFFIKTVGEGNDAIDNATKDFYVLGIGNGFISSYTVQGAVGGFPSVDLSIEGINMVCDKFDVTNTGAYIPAVNPTDGTPITTWAYQLPTGLTSYGNAVLTNDRGVSVLRPGDITLNLGIGAGDGFFDKDELKIQNFSLSFNLSRENLSQLGSKYAYAKAITFPVTAQMQVSALVGQHQTGNLYRIIEDNKDFNPTVTIKKPGAAATTIAAFSLKGAKMDNQDVSSSIGANKTVNMTFTSQIGGPQSLDKGLFMSGIGLP